MSNGSILPIDRILSGATTPGQRWPGSDGNEEVLHIPQSSSITRASPLDFLCHIQDTRWRVGSYLSAVMRSTFYSPSRLKRV